MNTTKNQEIKLNTLFNQVRGEVVNRYAGRFNSAGADVDEALSAALKYAAKRLLGQGKDFNAGDLQGVLCWKMWMLYQDACIGATRTHGRKSVKAKAVIDAEPLDGEDYRVSIVDKYSHDCYMMTARDGDDVDRSVLQSLAIRTTMKKNGASDRDADIVDRFLWSAPDRKALAAEFKTSVTNVNRIKCVWLQRLPSLAPQIRSCYAELLRQAA